MSIQIFPAGGVGAKSPLSFKVFKFTRDVDHPLAVYPLVINGNLMVMMTSYDPTVPPKVVVLNPNTGDISYYDVPQNIYPRFLGRYDNKAITIYYDGTDFWVVGLNEKMSIVTMYGKITFNEPVESIYTDLLDRQKALSSFDGTYYNCYYLDLTQTNDVAVCPESNQILAPIIQDIKYISIGGTIYELSLLNTLPYSNCGRLRFISDNYIVCGVREPIIYRISDGYYYTVGDYAGILLEDENGDLYYVYSSTLYKVDFSAITGGSGTKTDPYTVNSIGMGSFTRGGVGGAIFGEKTRLVKSDLYLGLEKVYQNHIAGIVLDKLLLPDILSTIKISGNVNVFGTTYTYNYHPMHIIAEDTKLFVIDYLRDTIIVYEEIT